MFSQRIRSVMEHDAPPTAAPQSTVSDASRMMATSRINAVLVIEGEQLLGIFTSGDAVRRVLAKGLDASSTRVADVMTAPVRTVHPEWTFGRALKIMHEHDLRQVPVVEGGKPIGILCARDALDPEMEEFACEAQRRVAFSTDPAEDRPAGKR